MAAPTPTFPVLLQVRVSEAMRDAVADRATAEGSSTAHIVRKALAEYLRRKPRR